MPDDRWERFAREDAESYICTAGDVDFSTPEGRALFLRTGHAAVARILEATGPYLRAWHRAVEIGCGVGRLTLPMAERFDEVVAVDIAPTMIRRLAENARGAGLHNVRGSLPDEPWFAQGSADLVYSLIVFQHIESWAEIARYFSRIAGCLAPGGVCYAHFDTRPSSLPYRIVRSLPDLTLPRRWRRGIRRIRRSPERLMELFDSCGLRVEGELRPDSAGHVFLLTRAARRA